jgi:tripartite-type tricarboxylate transporter receptor subunit TctC
VIRWVILVAVGLALALADGCAAGARGAARGETAATPAAGATADGGYDEQAIAAFYRGKTVKVLVGFPPGGGFDVVARIVAAALPNHLPGRPTVIVVNQPAAGSLAAANAISNVETQDGTVIGVTSERTILTQAVGDPAVQFDARKVHWLGSISSSPVTCALRSVLGYQSIAELIDGADVAMGSTGGTSQQSTLLLNKVLGTRFRVIGGYPGVAQVKLAIESGELDGLCLSWDGLRTLAPEWFKEPFYLRPISTMGPAAPPDEEYIRSVVRVEDLVKTDAARRLLTAYSKADEAAIPFHVGPNVPAERVAALRAALADVFKEPEVLERIEKAGRRPVPRTGEEVAAVYAAVLDTPPDVVDELRKILGP